jgi:hypothetical protein
VDIGAVGAVIVAALTTTKVVDGLAGEALGGKSGPGDDDLAVFVGVARVCGLMSSHLLGLKKILSFLSAAAGSDEPSGLPVLV